MLDVVRSRVPVLAAVDGVAAAAGCQLVAICDMAVATRRSSFSTPGANFGEDRAIFEAVHGSAPDIAGQNKANPLALLMSAVMMLKHLAETSGDESLAEAAERIKLAYDSCLKHGEKTGDLGGSLGTDEFADAVIALL